MGHEFLTKPEICFATSIVRIRTILGGADVKLTDLKYICVIFVRI